jgi:ABC-type transport system involved in cytochrome c biogenesis ATPase subunit
MLDGTSLSLRVEDVSLSMLNSCLFEKQSFSLHSGEILLISGNDSYVNRHFLDVVRGEISPDEGSIFFNQFPTFSQLETYRQHTMALVGAEDLSKSWTVDDYLDLLCGDEDVSVTHKIKAIIGLQDASQLLTSELSASQKSQLFLASLLMNEQPIWILGNVFDDLPQEYVEVFAEIIHLKLQRDGMIILSAAKDLSIDEGIGMHKLDISVSRQQLVG